MHSDFFPREVKTFWQIKMSQYEESHADIFLGKMVVVVVVVDDQ